MNTPSTSMMKAAQVISRVLDIPSPKTITTNLDAETTKTMTRELLPVTLRDVIAACDTAAGKLTVLGMTTDADDIRRLSSLIEQFDTRMLDSPKGLWKCWIRHKWTRWDTRAVTMRKKSEYNSHLREVTWYAVQARECVRCGCVQTSERLILSPSDGIVVNK